MRVVTSQWGLTRPSSIYFFSLGIVRDIVPPIIIALQAAKKSFLNSIWRGNHLFFSFLFYWLNFRKGKTFFFPQRLNLIFLLIAQNYWLNWKIFSRVLRDSTPRFVGPSVGHTLLFWDFCGFWPHCSCPNDLVTSIEAPAHSHATGVAVYPALLVVFISLGRWIREIWVNN